MGKFKTATLDSHILVSQKYITITQYVSMNKMSIFKPILISLLNKDSHYVIQVRNSSNLVHQILIYWIYNHLNNTILILNKMIKDST